MHIYCCVISASYLFYLPVFKGHGHCGILEVSDKRWHRVLKRFTCAVSYLFTHLASIVKRMDESRFFKCHTIALTTQRPDFHSHRTMSAFLEEGSSKSFFFCHRKTSVLRDCVKTTEVTFHNMCFSLDGIDLVCCSLRAITHCIAENCMRKCMNRIVFFGMHGARVSM